MRSLIKFVLGTGVAGALALVGTSGTAMADPPSGVTPPSNSIVGVGSDTTEYVMDQLALAYDAQSPAPTQKLYSWDATGSATLCPPKTGGTCITRPDGSGAGITALINNTAATVDYARSSRAPQAGDPTTIKFIPFAKDAVTVAVQTTTHAPTNLTTAQLKSIYTCATTNWSAVGGSAGTIKPFLPQAGSGTRSFFEAAVGITDAQVGSCVNSTVQENEGTNSLLNDPNAVVPYSTAKYIAQVFHSGAGQNSFGTDDHGTLKLDSINSTAPTTGSGSATTINPSFTAAFVRNVYNVVRKDSSTANQVPAYEQPVFDTAAGTVPGYICKNGATIVKNYGFLPLTGSQCGA